MVANAGNNNNAADDDDSDDDNYEISEVLGMRHGDSGEVLYEVSWVGMDSSMNTWENSEGFTEADWAAVKRFEARQASQ
jgi:hypothetical protein